METKNFKCRNCPVCSGYGCKGQMPGMGGTDNNTNFILNCAEWKNYLPDNSDFNPSVPLGLAPMTGAVENIGWEDEKSYYHEIIKACHNAGFFLTLGDGTPDEKLLNGIEAVRSLNSSLTQKTKASVFCKPYKNEKLFERFEWGLDITESAGIDIDAYNIITMRQKACLEKKDESSLLEMKKFLNSKGIPFIVKGVFNPEDVELCVKVKPDVVYVSNHGGRVPSRKGSVAQFLAENGKILKSTCNEMWADGGIRTKNDVKAAVILGADKILVGRPPVSALCKGGEKEVKRLFDSLH